MFATKVLTYLYQYGPTVGRTRKRISIPIAITFSKADLCPEADANPDAFARHNLPSLMQFCHRNVDRLGFFSSSAVGGVATCIEPNGSHWNVPLDVQPRGIVDPLEWTIRA
jgi:hypothetical protein